MGCSSSKHHQNFLDGNLPLSRSASFPGYGDIEDEGVLSKNSWRSSKPDYLLNDRGVSSTQGVDNIAHVNGYGMTDISEESKKHALVSKSVSPSPAQEFTEDTRSLLLENKLKSLKVRSADNTLNGLDSRTPSFRYMEAEDPNSGLRLLLSPVTTPSKSIAASSRFGNFSKTLSCGGRLAHHENDKTDFSRGLGSSDVHVVNLSLCEMEGMGDSEEPGSPLFDPSILATFERAIEASSDDNWQNSETSASSSSGNACSSSDACSDADSQNWAEENGIAQEVCGSPCTETGIEDEDAFKILGEVQRPISKSKKGFRKSKLDYPKRDYLEDFELKCPPGCEDKIVLYFTSLRGIRKTYENCGLVRLILKGFGVYVDERDIWMHSKFKEELTSVLGVVMSVPRLFIKGRHIGGAEDVKRLHEEGILHNLLEGLPVECDITCDMCGGVRFVPCTTCSGSCKMISIDEISRCPDCNENGLILCPSCGM